MSEKDLIFELLTIAEIQEDGTVEFTDRVEEIMQELTQRYEKSNLYKQSEKEKPDWINEATAREVYGFMCMKIESAPTLAHSLAAVKILLPTLWDKVQKEKLNTTAKEAREETEKMGLAYATD